MSSFVARLPLCRAAFAAFAVSSVLATPALAERESRFGEDTPPAAQGAPAADDKAPHGLGITLQIDNQLPVIIALWGKSPLTAAGVRNGDVITHVDGVPVRGQTIEQVANRLRGAKGSTVRLTVERKGAARQISVARTIRLQGGTWNDLLVDLKPMPDPNLDPPAADPRFAAEELRRGRSALDAGKIVEARDHLERAVAAAPDNAEARLRLAEAYVGAGSGEKALIELLAAKDTALAAASAVEKAALARGLRVEIAARDADPALDQAERIRRQSDARTCLLAPDYDCLFTQALNAAYGRGSLNDRVRALARLAPIHARAGRRDAAFRLLEEAATLARAAQPEPGFMIRPAQVRISELLAHVALGFRAAGDETAARRMADDAIETALAAGPMNQNDGTPGLSAEQVRSNAVNEVGNIFAREGYRDGAEKALEKAIDLSGTLLRRHWNGSNDTLSIGCGAANVQSLAWIRARYASFEETIDVLGSRHSCRYWIAKYGAGQFAGSRRYIDVVKMSGILLPVPAKAAVWAELAAKLAEDRLYVEAQATGAQAWALYNSATDATIGGRTYLEFSPSSDYVTAVERLARAGLVEIAERAAARIPAILRADPSNSYLDPAGIEKRVAESRARQVRNLVQALVDTGGRANVEKARQLAATLPAAADEWTRNSLFADLIAGEIRTGNAEGARELVRSHPKAVAGNLYRLVPLAVAAGEIELARTMTGKDANGRNTMIYGLIRAGKWDEATKLDPRAGMATRAAERQFADPKFDIKTLGFDYYLEPLADIRKADFSPFTATGANAGVAFRQGFALAAANYHHGAVDLFRAGLAAAPDNGLGQFYLAESLFRLGRYDEARGAYDKAKTLAPGTDEGRLATEALAGFDGRAAQHRATTAQARKRNAELAAALAASQKQKAALQGGAAEQARAAEEERRNAEANRKIREDSLKYMASFSLNSLGFYDGTKYVEKVIAKGDGGLPDHGASPVFRQALSAWQQSRGLAQTGELTLDVAERVEGEMHKLLTWGAACFRQPASNLDAAKRGDPIMRSLIMAQARIAARGCQQGERMNASSCQVCAAPPPELPAAGQNPMFVEK